MSLTSKISHHCMSVLIQQNIVAGGNTCIISYDNSYLSLPLPSQHVCCCCGTHLLRSLWMIGWVRLCRYSMPLATSMAMMSLDCRSISLSIETSLKQQPLSARSMVSANHTHHFTQINRTVYKDSTWPHS